jgi:hypothetical protein
MSGKGAKGLSGKGLSGKGAKGTMKGGDKKKPTSRSVKAGLQFPVGRIHRFLKVRIESSARRHATPAPHARRSRIMFVVFLFSNDVRLGTHPHVAPRPPRRA